MGSIFTDNEVAIYKAWLLNKKNAEIAKEFGFSESYISQTIKKVNKKVDKLNNSISILSEIGLIPPIAPLKLTEEGRRSFYDRRSAVNRLQTTARGGLSEDKQYSYQPDEAPLLVSHKRTKDILYSKGISPYEKNMADDTVFAKYFHTVQKMLLPDFQELDLSLNEARILLYLIIRQHSTATDVSKYTGIGRTETYHYLSNLLIKGVVLATRDRPQKYYALPYSEAIDCLIRAKQEALRKVSEDMAHNIVTSAFYEQEDKERYQAIIGEDAIRSKMIQILSNATNEVAMLVSSKRLLTAYHAELIDQAINTVARNVKLLLYTSSKQVLQQVSHSIQEQKRSAQNIDAIVLDYLETSPITFSEDHVDFIIADDKEMMVFVEQKRFKNSVPTGIYTTNTSLVTIFKALLQKV